MMWQDRIQTQTMFSSLFSFDNPHATAIVTKQLFFPHAINRNHRKVYLEKEKK